MTRGFVIMAQDTDTVNYTECAKALILSIHKFMPDANVTVINSDMLPHGDLGGYANDWQVYEASPYDETIKIEADMMLTRSIEHWFDILSIRDVAVCNTIRNFKGEVSDSRVYRKFIDDNKLPDVYNGITYFKKSPIAKQFFDTVRDIFENWDEYKTALRCNTNDPVSTDWAYAIACHIVGVEQTTVPNYNEFSFVHMKQFVNGLPTEDWTETLVYEFQPQSFRVNSYAQQYPFHYHIKTFSDKIIKGL